MWYPLVLLTLTLILISSSGINVDVTNTSTGFSRLLACCSPSWFLLCGKKNIKNKNKKKFCSFITCRQSGTKVPGFVNYKLILSLASQNVFLLVKSTSYAVIVQAPWFRGFAFSFCYFVYIPQDGVQHQCSIVNSRIIKSIRYVWSVF